MLASEGLSKTLYELLNDGDIEFDLDENGDILVRDGQSS
jgi:hypothetical protein